MHKHKHRVQVTRIALHAESPIYLTYSDSRLPCLDALLAIWPSES